MRIWRIKGCRQSSTRGGLLDAAHRRCSQQGTSIQLHAGLRPGVPRQQRTPTHQEVSCPGPWAEWSSLYEESLGKSTPKKHTLIFFFFSDFILFFYITQMNLSHHSSFGWRPGLALRQVSLVEGLPISLRTQISSPNLLLSSLDSSDLQKPLFSTQRPLLFLL